MEMNAGKCTVVTYGVAPAEWWLRLRARQFSVRGGQRQSVQPKGLPLMLITLHEQNCSLQQSSTYRGIKYNAFIKIPNNAGSLCYVSAMSPRLKYLSLQLQSCHRFNTYSTDILTHSARTCVRLSLGHQFMMCVPSGLRVCPFYCVEGRCVLDQHH